MKIGFGQYPSAILTDKCEIWNGYEESRADIGRMTKTEVFENSRWRTAAISKISLSPYLNRQLSDFDQIWYADANLYSEMYFYQISKFCKFKMADGMPY